MSIGARIFEIRKLRGLSQEALGEAAGLGKSAISQYESGKRGEAISSQTLADLAKALRVSERWLRTGEGGIDADDAAEAEGPIEAGFRRFHEFVRDREAQHLALVPEFLQWRARGASRYPATISAVDVEEELVADFRRWRRGRDAGDGVEAITVRSKTGRAFPGTE